MKKNVLNRYTSDTLDLFRKNLTSAEKNPGSKSAIHDLRVSIKRIKALLNYCRKTDKDFDYHEIYRPFRNLFQNAGRCRTSQIYISKAQKAGYALPGKIPSSISALPKVDIIKTACDSVAGSINALPDDKIKSKTKTYLRKLNRKILKIIESEPEERAMKLHILRKKLKELGYNLDFLKKDKKLDISGHPLDTWLCRLMKLLGEWHDNILIINQIENSISGKDPFNQEFKEKLIGENENLIKKINKILDDRKMVQRMLPWAQ